MSSSKNPIQLCLTVKDIMRVSGKSERQSREDMQKVRASCGKSKSEDVTVFDYCKYMKISVEEYKQLFN